MKRYRGDILAIGSLLLLVAIFFARLFYPEPQLIVTPDYGRSDAWHFSFATKFALWEALHHRSLPLWRSDLGNGFPLLAEGQVGALFIPNLMLFSFLPVVTAYNLALVLSVALLTFGVYWCCRLFGLPSVGGVFAAITVSFSGLTLTQLTHMSLLQGMSLLPWILALSHQVVTADNNRIWFAALSLVLSQQLLAGFPQAAVLSLVLSSAYVLWRAWQSEKWRVVITWLAAIVLGVVASAVQLLPSWEFLRESTDPSGFTPTGATMYSMPVSHFLSFVSPFALGNPKYGTYPPFYAFDGSIFWENTPNIGLLPLLLLILSLRMWHKNPPVRFFWGAVLWSLLLALGKYAPTYIIYSIWPLTLFRVPSRFLWITVFAVAVISSASLGRLRFRFLPTVLCVIQAAHLLFTWWSYHQIEPAHQWIEKPVAGRDLTRGRVLTIGEPLIHNDVMTTSGWSDPAHYRFLKNGLSPDSNMLWGIEQSAVYAGRYLRRPAITASLLSGSIQTDNRIATVSATKWLDLFSVGNILSFLPLDAPDLLPIQTITESGRTLTVSQNPNALRRAYLVYEATAAGTLKQAIEVIQRKEFIPGVSVLLEQHEVVQEPNLRAILSQSELPPASSSATILSADHTILELAVETPKDALLVVTDTVYPGWEVSVDGIKTKLLTANLSQKAVFVPKGNHRVTLTYQPKTVWWGSYISAGTYVLIILQAVVPIFWSGVHTRKGGNARARHSPNTDHTLMTPV